MLVNQTLIYSVSDNTNNIRFKLCKNSFNAIWKKAAQGSPLPPTQLPRDPTKYTANPSFHEYCVLVVMFMVGQGLPKIFCA